MILRALEDEKFGICYSIDLANSGYYVRGSKRLHQDVLSSTLQVGYAIPEELRARWRLIIGDSVVELPRLLNEIGQIDVFFHDSKHTYDHMMSEFRLAWPHLREGGLLLSDDANWNDSLRDFALSAGIDWRVQRAFGFCAKTPGVPSPPMTR